MEDERLSEVSRKRHLPDELCREILLRMPVKSLLRFRCVSKAWLSLISDPEFCRVHLKSFKNNIDETHLLVLERCVENNYCVVSCSDTLQTNGETPATLPTRCRSGYWRTKCSLDGLVLLQSYTKEGSPHDTIVWNPSIRKFHQIPPVPETETPRDSGLFDVEVGLVYDPSEDDYKHVKFIFTDLNDLHSVAVYSLGAHFWKIVQFQGERSSNWHWDLAEELIKAVYLQGSLYFICYEPNKEITELVSFSLGSEVFCSVNLPAMAATVDMMSLELVASGSSITLFHFDVDKTSLWHYGSGTESESMLWTEHISQELNITELLFFKKNGDMLIWSCEGEMTISGVTGNRLQHQCGLVSSYNLQTREEKILLLQNEEIDWDVCGYVESLVLP